MKNTKRKQYYKIHIDPEDVLTEDELREQVYGQRKLTPFECIGVELSHGYFNAWLVLIITLISLLFGILIGSLDASRRFDIPISEVLSLSLSKSDLRVVPVDNSGQQSDTDDVSTNTEPITEKLNLDGFNGTINVYYDQVHIGDVIEGSYSDNTSKDNQYINVDPTVSSTSQLGKANDNDDTKVNDSEIVTTPILYPRKSNDSTTYSRETNLTLNIDKTSYNDKLPEDDSDNSEQNIINASGQDTEDNVTIGESLPITRPSELDNCEPDDCVIGDSSQLLDNDVSSNPSNSDRSPLWYEVVCNLFYASFIIFLLIFINKKKKQI